MGSAPQTTRQVWPLAVNWSSHARLLRVDPPRGGRWEALDASSMRIPLEFLAVRAVLLLGQQRPHFFVGKSVDLLQDGGIAVTARIFDFAQFD